MRVPEADASREEDRLFLGQFLDEFVDRGFRDVRRSHTCDFLAQDTSGGEEGEEVKASARPKRHLYRCESHDQPGGAECVAESRNCLGWRMDSITEVSPRSAPRIGGAARAGFARSDLVD